MPRRLMRTIHAYPCARHTRPHARHMCPRPHAESIAIAKATLDALAQRGAAAEQQLEEGEAAHEAAQVRARACALMRTGGG